MPTVYPDFFAALAQPFYQDEIKTRSGGGGRQLAYITARQAMNRLDTVCGPENWRNRYRLESLPAGLTAVVCTIEIKVEGEWVGKEDAGGFKAMTEKNRDGQQVEDEENTVKTGYSDAFKRAAVLWGIGRELYRDGVAWFDVTPQPQAVREPELARSAPAEAAPADDRPPPKERGRWGNNPTPPPEPAPQQDRPSNGGGNQPRSGKALFAWLKEQEQTHEIKLLSFVNAYGKQQGFPGRIVDWDSNQAIDAYKEAARKIQSLVQAPDSQGDAYEGS